MTAIPRSRFGETVIYQIYPRSFADSTGNGIGDLAGITAHLDYLAGSPDSLGVTAIWLSPFYPSSMADFGYDITDYCNVDPLFGTLEDFDELLEQAHRRRMQVLLDLVPNHTSDEHPWFMESRSSRDNPKRDWYIWRDAKPNGSPPNNWLGSFGGSAWEYDDNTGQYYMHSFLAKQPDLNWQNPAVRRAINDVVRFWARRGVDGFRVDAASWLSKDLKWRDNPINHNFDPAKDGPEQAVLPKYNRSGPHLYDYLQGIANVVGEFPGRYMITEAYPDESDDPEKYYTKLYRNVDASLSAPFNFELIFADWTAPTVKKIIDDFQRDMQPEYTPVYCLGNHDQQRLASRIGEQQARMAALLLLTLPGVPVLYYGDELGMTDGDISPDQRQDPAQGWTGSTSGRDPARTPMLWSNQPNAGFTSGQPWLPVNSDFASRNAELQRHDDYSSWHLYKRLLQLRKDLPALDTGSYQPLEVDNGDVYGFRRSLDDQKLTILLNFSDDEQTVVCPLEPGRLLMTSVPEGEPIRHENRIRLRPYEAVLLEDIKED